ncbi:hypothetical protein TcG_12904 [Trypanosoma cruzi]|nr:hypothetical protein TcG_12904 [Trypanosoma cruzi]
MTAGDQRVGAVGGNKSIGNRLFSLSVLEPMNLHEGTGCRLPASTCEQRIHAHTDDHRKSLCDHSGLLWTSTHRGMCEANGLLHTGKISACTVPCFSVDGRVAGSPCW